MSAQTKILIGFIAIVALVIGISFNAAQVKDGIDTQDLLNAQLIASDFSASDPAQQLTSSSVKESLGELTLVNFWASWCSPCREEMPLFETMYRQAKTDGFVVIGIAIDTPDKTQAMLDSMDITYPILYAQETGITVMDSVGNPQGLLPYSVLLDSNGNVIEHVLGQIHEQQIADWINTYL